MESDHIYSPVAHDANFPEIKDLCFEIMFPAILFGRQYNICLYLHVSAVLNLGWVLQVPKTNDNLSSLLKLMTLFVHTLSRG